MGKSASNRKKRRLTIKIETEATERGYDFICETMVTVTKAYAGNIRGIETLNVELIRDIPVRIKI